VENYTKSIAFKKADSIKKISLIIKNKQNIFKQVFIANLKSRAKIETVMRKYIKGYSKDRIRIRKLSRNNSNSFYSPNKEANDIHSSNNYSISSYSNNYIKNNLYQSQNQDKVLNNNFNTLSSVYNNTSGSYMKNALYSSELNIKNNYSNNTINLQSEKKKINKQNGDSNHNVFDRLNSKNKISNKNSINIANEMIPSRELKEMKELEECTFQPKINYYYPSCNDDPNHKYNNSINDSLEGNSYGIIL